MVAHPASTRTAALALNAEQRITEWNESASRLLGYSSASAVGKPCWKILQSRDSAGNRYCGRACMLCRMALAGEPIGAVELSVRHASGKRLNCKVTTLVDDLPADLRIVHLLEPVDRSDQRKPAGIDSLLTPRESELLRLFQRGKTTAEIAGILSVAPSTVRTHAEHVLKKLGTHSRLEAVAEGRRLGLLK